MSSIPPELLVLLALSIAAGIDLYLTLLFIGASPTLGLWDQPLMGALADLDSPSVLIVVGSIYLLEFAAERNPATALVWNAFHAVIRPLSGALLALLLLDGQPLLVTLAGAALAGALASWAHAVRSGGAVIRWLGEAESPNTLLVSLLEDVVAVALVALVLDAPLWSFAAAATLLVVVSPLAVADARAFTFAIRLAGARVFQSLSRRRWLGPDELPAWVRDQLEHDDVLAPGGALRGSPVGAHRIAGAPRFAIGWVLVRGGSPVLVWRLRGRVRRVDLGRMNIDDIAERAFFRRVDLTDLEKERDACLFFSLNGPSVASLRAEFVGGR